MSDKQSTGMSPRKDPSVWASRLAKLKQDYMVEERVREGQISKAISMLHSISEEQLEILTPYFKVLPDICRMTVEDLRNDANGEVNRINSLHMMMVNMIEEGLSKYEKEL